MSRCCPRVNVPDGHHAPPFGGLSAGLNPIQVLLQALRYFASEFVAKEGVRLGRSAIGVSEGRVLGASAARGHRRDRAQDDERGVVLRVEAFDRNCPQHITPRFTEDEIRASAVPLFAKIETLAKENRELRAPVVGPRTGA